MAAKTPIRAVFTGSDATGLSEFQTGEFVDYAFGGTGLTSLGSAGQVLKINSGGTALEYGNVEAVINIDGATDLTGSTLVAGDQIILSDGGTEGRVTLSQLDTLFSGTTQTLTNKTLTSPTITGTGAIAGTFTGNITGDVTGNADTATTLATARTIAGQSFDGSANITIASTDLSNTSDVVLLDSTQTLTNKSLTSPTITGTGAIAGTFTGNITGDVTGNADTATTLATARTIAGQSFDGSSNITIAATDLSDTDQSLSTTDNVTFNDMTVSGNLTVSGTTTTVNTETINLADNTITLNSNETGTPSQDGGIEIERGTSTNKTLIWNETTDKWTIGSETFVAATFEGALTGNVTGDVTGNADTATALETARTIGGVSFDGSANINLPGVNTSGNQDTSGNAATATALETARTIAGVSFDGSANISIAPTDLTGVTATAAEINKLDGVTATTAELNFIDGVTSAIQTQLDSKTTPAFAIAQAIALG
jgi:hypothetical protein